MNLVSKNGGVVPPRPQQFTEEVKQAGIKAYFEKHSFSAFGIESDNEADIEKFMTDYARHYFGFADGYELAKDLEDDGWNCNRDWIDELEAIGSFICQAQKEALDEWVKTYEPEPPFPVGVFITNGLITGINVKEATYQVKVKNGEPNSRGLVNFEEAALDEAAMKEMDAFIASSKAFQGCFNEKNLNAEAYKLAFIIDLEVGLLLPHVRVDAGLKVTPEFYKETAARLLDVSAELKVNDGGLQPDRCVFNCKVGHFENERYISLDAQFFEEAEQSDLVRYLPYEALSRVMSQHCSYLSSLKMLPTPIHAALHRQIERNKASQDKEACHDA
ncbi:hypothetical protein [Vibrio europaeus]|uniref:hypothetical protein n=1 Tax=Vibrio europaeus TaxID=300876 RepID=UPI00233EF5A7|nr:hypothetical protein [Vibrio europaeus]MDC5753551.1 hypothetical protein [Vibrio europaeus]MDC5816537.1 hypothetical protein [Vibrio europaeus]